MTTPADDRPFPLSMAESGVPVRIVALGAGRELDRRLTELGLNIGAVITVCQRQGGSLLVARGETRLAVGGGMAHKIRVVRL